MKELIEEILSASHEVRYVAIYHRGELHSRERAGLADASSSESDHYEELLVNPTLLTLTNQRGNIDCGGLEYLVIRYGNFFQLVHPIKDGHISVAVNPDGQPLDVMKTLRAILEKKGLLRKERLGPQ
ncbi:MAG TPA: hypothetical protein VFG11_00835 [Acidobacteriota bacterium]|nr:hypothetical protein [Acidobacteriota bacterium]